MAFLYLTLLLLLFFGVLGAVVYFFTDLTNRAKYIILATLIMGWTAIAIYSAYQHHKRIIHDMLYYEYTHGNPLICKTPFGQKVTVDKKNFNFVSGTMVFVGKEGTSYEELVVPMDSCKKEE